jgi:STE24 endopeptidase
MHFFSIAFLVALLAHLVVQTWLARRQIMSVARHRNTVPAGFATAVSGQEHAKAADYTIARQRFGIFELVFDAAVLAWLTLGGGIAGIGNVVAGIFDGGPIISGTAHVLGVFAVLALLALPLSIYRTFVLEQRFGFNRTDPRTFLIDQVKGWALGLVLGGALTACVLWIMTSAGPRWWIVAWLAWMSFALLATWAWPRLIAPLFNRFTPLDDQALRSRIDALLERCGFHTKAVFVMDGSKRSSHGNAYFTGLGREKRIVFFDTLLTSLTPPQVESVLAHELAHFRLRHVPQRLFVGALVSLAGFALLGWLSLQPWFYSGLGVPAPSAATALLLFMLATPVFTWLVAPLFAAWSRRHEFEADAFAAEYSDAQSLADALVTLYKDNASTLTPDPIHSAFYDSHPPPAARIARLAELRRTPVRAATAQ